MFTWSIQLSYLATLKLMIYITHLTGSLIFIILYEIEDVLLDACYQIIHSVLPVWFKSPNRAEQLVLSELTEHLEHATAGIKLSLVN